VSNREARRWVKVEGGARRWRAAGWPAASGAAAHRRGPLPPRGQPRTRPLVVPAVTHTPVTARARANRAVLPAPGILKPRKDHNQGRTSSLRSGRSTLILIFHGKRTGTYQEDRIKLDSAFLQDRRLSGGGGQSGQTARPR
jgi:hypothetical protein